MIRFSLSDAQLDIVADAARKLPIEKRSVLLERVAGQLAQRSNFNDADVGHATEMALRGLLVVAAA